MNYKQEVNLLAELKKEEQRAYEDYQRCKHNTQLCIENIIKAMQEDGVARVEGESAQVVKAKKKSTKIVNTAQLLSHLTAIGVSRDMYTDVSRTKLNAIVKKMTSDGSDVPGVEKEEKEYLSFKPKKDEE